MFNPKFAIALGLLASAVSVTSQAQSSINLGNYSVAGIYALDTVPGTSGVSGLEASGVTYARDRGTLFYVGDEGTGVVEISLTGQTIGTSAFNWSGTGSGKHDTEGVAYLGGGVLVIGEERLQDVYRFTYSAGSTVTLVSNFVSISNTSVANSGMEGITYDPRNGSFITVKQENPEDILSGTLTFGAATGGAPSTSGDGTSPGGGGVANMSQLFNPTVLGLSTLSDVQTLSPVDALAGTAAADNLLILSLGSRRLLEVDRSGNIKSSFDLSNVLPNNGIEGVTVDQFGNIYLVAEQDQRSGVQPGPGVQSQLIVLSNPALVPEPGSAALLGAGLLGLVGFRRRQATTVAI